jgi:hypothetical protein
VHLDRGLGMALLAAIVVLGFLTRGVSFASPLLDFHSWRQADTAAVSRNFVKDGLNPLRPRVDHIGPGGSSMVVTGFEMHAWLVALVCSGMAKFEPGVGRILSSIWFVGSALLVWSLCRRRYGEGAALAGTLAYAFGFPLMFYVERAFMNEALLVLLGFVALHEAQRYVHEERRAALAALAASLLLIAVMKPTFLLVVFPVAGLFAEKGGWRGLLRWEPAVLAALAGGVCYAWFTNAQASVGDAGVTFGLTDKFIDARVLGSSRYYSLLANRLVKDILGPLGFVALVVGAVAAVRQGRRMEVAGLAAFVAYLGTVAVGNFAHNYYQLTIMPVAAPTVALGLWTWVARGLPDPAPAGTVALRLLLVTTILAGTSLVRFAGPYSWFRVDWTARHLCDALPRVVGKDEKLVFAGYNSPDILFCADRRGWLLPPEGSTAEAIRRAVDQGASVLIVDNQWAARQAEPPYTSSASVIAQNRRFTALRVR